MTRIGNLLESLTDKAVLPMIKYLKKNKIKYNMNQTDKSVEVILTYSKDDKQKTLDLAQNIFSSIKDKKAQQITDIEDYNTNDKIYITVDLLNDNKTSR